MNRLLVFLAFLGAVGDAAYPPHHVVGIVDREPITHQDVLDRLHLLLTFSGQAVTQELQHHFYTQVLQGLMEEWIQRQAAEKVKITVSEKEVENRIQEMEKQNHVPKGGLKRMLLAKHIPYATLLQQVRSSMVWARYLEGKYAHCLHVRPKDMDRALAKWHREHGKMLYRVAEIVFYTRGDSRVSFQHAQGVKALLGQGVSFAKLAQQFSESPSKSQGGDLGFQGIQHFDPALHVFLSKAPLLSMIGPISIPSHQPPLQWVILVLIDRKSAQELSLRPPSKDDLMRMLVAESLSLWSRKELENLRQKVHCEIRSPIKF